MKGLKNLHLKMKKKESQMANKLPPLISRGPYQPTRLSQRFGDLKIVSLTGDNGLWRAHCSRCGKEEAVSEKRLSEGATACLACTARMKMEAGTHD
jgi:hypothetical protein